MLKYTLNQSYQSIDSLNFYESPWQTNSFNSITIDYQRLLHPFYSNNTKIHPGKFFHIDSIFHALSTTSCDIHGDMVCYPLLSQPMIELAISIPTYMMYGEGYDRILFRKAISQYFQTENVWRKDKGEVTGIFQFGMKENRDYIIDLISQGYFFKNDLVNKEDIIKTIDAICIGYSDNQWSLNHLIAVEIFIDYWKDFI